MLILYTISNYKLNNKLKCLYVPIENISLTNNERRVTFHYKFIKIFIFKITECDNLQFKN